MGVPVVYCQEAAVTRFAVSLLCIASLGGFAVPATAQNYYNDQNRAREHSQSVQRESDRHYDSVAADNRARLEEEARQAERERWADSYSRDPQVEETAGQRIVRKARNGDPEAMFIVSANYYEGGDDFAPDPARGLLWLRRAAEAGYPQAQMTLASMLVQGEELQQDKDEAFYWASRAADQGFVPAYMMLGMMYENGDGVAQDTDQARGYYRQAVEGGFAPAQERLAALGG